jgi:hypothetical protein
MVLNENYGESEKNLYNLDHTRLTENHLKIQNKSP